MSIIVGVDGSEGAATALRFAADEARARGTILRIVLAWRLPLIGPGLDRPWRVLPGEAPFADHAEALEREAAARLAETLEAVGPDALAGLEVDAEVVEAAPAAALLERAGPDDLLVVGSRGRDGFAGLRLGSVAAQCTHHARCPVVIVPAAGA